MNLVTPSPATLVLPAETAIGSVSLAVADLARSLAFYRDIAGFEVLASDEHSAQLGTAGTPLLHLAAQPGAVLQPRYSTGLYHVAILLPTRADLARTIVNLITAEYPLSGASDHAVSEAFYLNDPDGNGVEIYRDRPRSEWRWNGSQVHMDTRRLDLNAVFDSIAGEPRAHTPLPAGTRIGHVHLRVGDLAAARAFYNGVLGFDVVQQAFPGALFVSAGGYHHHLGLNTWESAGAPLPPANAVGLRQFTLLLPSDTNLEAFRATLEAAGVPVETRASELLIHDPWRNQIVLAASA